VKTLTGQLIQAGTDELGVTSVTFTVTPEQLRDWPLPFYRELSVTIADDAKPDPLANHPELFKP